MPKELIITSSARELWLSARGYSRYHDTLPFPEHGLRDWLAAIGYLARTRRLIDRAPALVAGASVRPSKPSKRSMDDGSAQPRRRRRKPPSPH